jgi:hypothetical protein
LVIITSIIYVVVVAFHPFQSPLEANHQPRSYQGQPLVRPPFNQVFACRLRGEDLAVKEVWVQTADGLAAVQKEVAFLTSLAHPHLVQLHGK